jgi:hypothetical protein
MVLIKHICYWNGDEFIVNHSKSWAPTKNLSLVDICKSNQWEKVKVHRGWREILNSIDVSLVGKICVPLEMESIFEGGEGDML